MNLKLVTSTRIFGWIGFNIMRFLYLIVSVTYLFLFFFTNSASKIPQIVTAMFRSRIILGAPLPPTLVMYPARLKLCSLQYWMRSLPERLLFPYSQEKLCCGGNCQLEDSACTCISDYKPPTRQINGAWIK